MNNLNWIIVPVLGAIIGYTTNWIAIKMLFRPSKAYYLGKFKIPFTPGIIPKERDRIALSLGKTISKNILNQEVITEELTNDNITSALSNNIKKRLSKTIVIADYLDTIRIDKDVISDKITDKITEILVLESNDDIVNSIVLFLQRDETIGSKLPENNLEVTKKLLDNNSNKINSFTINTLKRDEIAESITKIIAALIESKLGILKSFIKAETVYNAIVEATSEYIDTNDKVLSTLIFEEYNKFLAHDLKDYATSDQISSLANTLSNSLKHYLAQDSTRQTIKNAVNKILNHEINLSEKRIKQIDDIVINLYLATISKEAFSLVEVMDLKTIVYNKINSFTNQEIEELTLEIARKELNAITSLGALLGLIMGSISLLF